MQLTPWTSSVHRWDTEAPGQRVPPHLIWLDVANNNFTRPSIDQADRAAGGSGQPTIIASKGACTHQAAWLVRPALRLAISTQRAYDLL